MVREQRAAVKVPTARLLMLGFRKGSYMFGMGGNGRGRFVMPVVIVIWFGIMFTLMFWPMTHMQMDNLPFAILSLDEGAQTPAGEMNVGDTLVESLTSGGDESSDDEDEDSTSSMIAWTQFDSEEALDEALENVEYYGALIIPEDYTAATMAAQTASSGAQAGSDAAQSGVDESQLQALAAQTGMDASQLQALIAQVGEGDMDESQLEALAAQYGMDPSQLQALAAQAGGGGDTSADAIEADTASASDAPTLTMLIDNAKSPMVANMLRTSIASMFSEMGAEVDVQVIHDGSESAEEEEEAEEAQDTEEEEDSASGSFSMASMYGTMMGQQLGIMPVCMITMMASMMIARAFRRKEATTKRGAWMAMLRQVLYALGLSFLISILALIMIAWVAGVDIPLVTGGLFIWIAAFCMMLLYLALNNIAGWLGMIGGFCISMLGMMTGIFPSEMLPTFWQDFIYPWTPQHFVGGGLRLIEYVNGGVWNAETPYLLIYGIVGVVLFVIIGFIPTKAQREHRDQLKQDAEAVPRGAAQDAEDDVSQAAEDVSQTLEGAVQDGADAVHRTPPRGAPEA